jgi:uncharacterized protein (TIGR03086 family)
MGRTPDDRGRPGPDNDAVTDHHRRTGTASRVARLVELGRDREAAELGASDHPGRAATAPAGGGPSTTGAPVHPLDQLDQLAPALGGVTGGITPDQLGNPTACAALTVEGILDHMVQGATMFAAAFRGEPAPDAPEPGDGLDRIGPALGDLVAALHSPGALDRTIASPFGDMPGADFARYVVLDGLVHGWDLARATGQPYDPPAAVVDAATAYAHEVLGPYRDGDTFADATEPPVGASPMERLAAYTGRRVIPAHAG